MDAGAASEKNIQWLKAKIKDKLKGGCTDQYIFEPILQGDFFLSCPVFVPATNDTAIINADKVNPFSGLSSVHE